MIRLKLNDVEMVNTCIPMYRNTTVSVETFDVVCASMYVEMDTGRYTQNYHYVNCMKRTTNPEILDMYMSDYIIFLNVPLNLGLVVEDEPSVQIFIANMSPKITAILVIAEDGFLPSF